MRKIGLKWFRALFLMMIINWVVVASCEAMPAAPGSIDMSQPSGQTFLASLNGDEWENWVSTTADDNVIIQDTDGYWKYAEVNFGQLAPSDAKVGIDPAPPESITDSQWKALVEQYSEDAVIPKTYYSSGMPAPSSVPAQPAGAPQKVLVLMVGFTDRAIVNTENTWSNSFFGDTGKTVKNFYKENSAGNFYFSPADETYGTANDGVVKVTLGYAHPNTGGSTSDANRQVVKDALIAADAFVNYASFDTNGNGYIDFNELHIVTIIAGFERSYDTTAPSVWGHRWALGWSVPAPLLDGKSVGLFPYGGYTQQGEYHGGHMATIGILSHELGHDIGLFDEYNTSTGSAVVGASSLMDVGSWGMAPGDWPGGSPAHMDPWSKIFLNFVTPVDATSGVYTMKSASTGLYNVLKVATSDPNQYFLIENRNRSGFDDGLNYEGIANGGVAIWHIEDAIIAANMSNNTVNANGHNPGVWLEKSVSSVEPYYRNAGPKDTFNDTSTPNSKLYSGVATNVSVKALDPTGTSMQVQIGSLPTFQFAPSTYNVAENGANVTITVTRTGDTTGAQTVDYTTNAGTATAGADYTTTSGTISFAAGETSKTFTVPILDDVVYEGNETFTTTLSNPSFGSLGTSTATVTITEDDVQPTSFAITPTATTVGGEGAFPGGANVTLTITRSGNTTGVATVDYTTNDGTALAGSDYTAQSGTITFNNGETTKTISVNIKADGVCEGDESFTVTLSNPSVGTITGGTATLTISDFNVVLGSLTYSVAENAGSINVTIQRGTSRTALTHQINYTTTNGTATGGTDYTSVTSSVTFGVGETVKTITIPITNDALFEGDETFTLTISDPNFAATIQNPTTTVTITDDDPPVPLLAFNPTTYTVGENGASINLTVTRTASTTGILTVDYTTANGTAVAGADFTTTSGTLTFADGEAVKTITVPILEDTAYEGNETLTVTLSNPSLGNITAATATVTITDNDVAPVIQLSSATYNAAETAGTVTVTVQRAGATGGASTVNYATTNGTATSGLDYTATSGTLNFAAGETSKTINVTLLNDSLYEGDETFSFSLSVPTLATLGGTSSATVTINDGQASLIKFNGATYTVGEGGTASITVVRIGDTSGTSTANYNTANGSALSGADYTATSGTITFNPGDTTKTFDVITADDAVGEGTETVALTLSGATGSALSGTGAQSNAILSITDNDGPTGTLTSLTFDSPWLLAAVGVGATKNATVNGVFSDGSVGDITGLATWTSSHPGVATVVNGQVTGVAPGTTVVYASYGGYTTQVTITVR